MVCSSAARGDSSSEVLQLSHPHANMPTRTDPRSRGRVLACQSSGSHALHFPAFSEALYYRLRVRNAMSQWSEQGSHWATGGFGFLTRVKESWAEKWGCYWCMRQPPVPRTALVIITLGSASHFQFLFILSPHISLPFRARTSLTLLNHF